MRDINHLLIPTTLNSGLGEYLVPIEATTSDVAIRAFQASQLASQQASRIAAQVSQTR